MTVSARMRTAAALIAASAMVGAPGAVAGAVEPPQVPAGPAPGDPPPEPDQPMRQIAACTVTGILPGSDVRELPPALALLNMPAAWKESTGAGVVVGIIDTGVAAQPRLPHLVAGGDYVMGRYGDGLSDCDAHGTLVASLIGAAPSGTPLPVAPREAAPAAPPPAAPAPAPIPPPAPPPTVTITQTVSPPPPPPPPPEDAPAWGLAPPRRTGSGDPAPLAPPPGGGTDGLIGIAPDAVLVSIRQTAQTFGLADPGVSENPEDIRRAGDIDSLARAIVHAANLGVKVINISVVSCISATKPHDQSALGAALRYAAVDRDVVIVTAAGNTNAQGCNHQNPPPLPGNTDDPLGWGSVTTIAAPAWFSDYVLAVSATDANGVPLTEDVASLHGPWMGLAAPGTDIMGLSPAGEVINGSVDQDKLHSLAGSSFSAAFVSGIAALVRAKYPDLSAHQVIHRLQATAHPPAAGRDPVVGYGVVDPVAALTWDIAPGALLPPGAVRGPLVLPPPPIQRDPRPGQTAATITAVMAASLVAVAIATTVVRRRRRQS